MNIKSNIPIEVTERQYKMIPTILPGIVAYNIKNGKYRLKLMLPKYKHYLAKLLEV